MARKKPRANSEAPAVEIRAAIDELLTVWDELSDVTVGRAKAERLLVTQGLAQHAMRMAAAALVLIDLGMPVEATPLARVAFEQAVVAQRVAVDGAGLEAYRALSYRDHKRFYDAAKPLTSMPDDLRVQFEDMAFDAVAAREIAQFKDVCGAFDSSGWLYLMYKALSQPVHPSAMAAQGDLALTASGFIVSPASNPSDLRFVLFPLALAVALASGAVEDLRKAKPNKARLRAIAARAGVPTMLRLGDTAVRA